MDVGDDGEALEQLLDDDTTARNEDEHSWDRDEIHRLHSNTTSAGASRGISPSNEDDVVDVEVVNGQLPKTLRVWGGISFIVGVMIGSGIFASPGSVLLRAQGDIVAALMAWTTAGVVALLGAVCYAELGTVVQESGGEYVYICRALGDMPAFLFSWANCLITRPGSQAIITLVFGEYAAKPFYEGQPPELLVKGIAITINLVIFAINSLSVRAGARLQSITTGLKLVALAIIAIVGLTWLRNVNTPGEPAHDNFTGSSAYVNVTGHVNAAQFGSSVIAGLWSFDGWNNLNYITAEMIQPRQDLPRALFIGIPLVIVAYLLINIAYLAVLPITSFFSEDGSDSNPAFASDFGDASMGTAGRVILPLCIVASTLGSANGTAFSGARVTMQSSRQGHLPAVLGRLWGRDTNTAPGPALFFQTLVAIVMIIPGNFESLVDYFSAAAWFFYFLAVLSLLKLRRDKVAKHVQAFRVPLVLPIVFLFIAAGLVLSLIISAPVNAAISFTFILSGLPAFYFRRRLAAWARRTLPPKLIPFFVQPTPDFRTIPQSVHEGMELQEGLQATDIDDGSGNDEEQTLKVDHGYIEFSRRRRDPGHSSSGSASPL